MTNTVGMKTDGRGLGREALAESYRLQLAGVGISEGVEIRHDGEDDYDRHFLSTIESDSLRERIYEDDEEMLWCGCGKVEIPLVPLRKLLSQQRPKSLVRGNSLSSARCVSCSGPLKKKKEKVLKLRTQPTRSECHPALYQSEVKSAQLRLSERDLVITRNHRSESRVYDTDFRWLPYLSWVRGTEEKVILVVGPTTINQAQRVISLFRVMCPKVEIQLLVHPLVRVQDSRLPISGMSIEAFYELEPSILCRRAFLSSGIQWGRTVTALRSDVLHLARQSLGRLTKERGRITAEESLEGFMWEFNQKAIFELLKRLRSGRVTDSLLYQVLVGSQL